MSIVVYHNEACGTSRNTLQIIRDSGEEPMVINYLDETAIAWLVRGSGQARP